MSDDFQQRLNERIARLRDRYVGSPEYKFTEERFDRLAKIEEKHAVKFSACRSPNGKKEFVLFFVSQSDGHFVQGFSGPKTLEDLLGMAEDWFAR